MHHTYKKLICLLLTLSVIFSLTACGSGDGITASNPYDNDYVRGSFEYEDVYTQQHLDFIESGDYADIIAVSGGLAGALSDTYINANLNWVNGSWKSLSDLTVVLGEGKIQLVNEYEIMVSMMMQNTGAEEGFVSSFQENYYDAVIKLMGGINDQLKTAQDNTKFFTGGSIDEVAELTKKLDAILVTLQKIETPDAEASGLFSDAVDQLKKAFDESFLKENEAFLDTVKDSLGMAMNVSSLVSESITDMMDEYLMYEAMSGASEEWERVWIDIASNARSYVNPEKENSDEGKKIAECIDTILERTKSYREDNYNQIMNSALRTSGKNLAEFAYSSGYEVFDGMMKSWPIGEAIRQGFVQGVNLANVLMNCDDIAYYGQMMVGFGCLARCAFDTMITMEGKLTSSKTYDNALLFDEAFNIYKEIQMSAVDCAIDYCQTIIEANLGQVFKYTIDDEVTDTFLLQAYKAEWLPYRCHGISEVINNGGNVVGYNGSIYYFRMNSNSLEESATNAAFTFNQDVANDLVCRSSDGTESVILSATATGSIYICAEHIIYQKYDGIWYAADLSDPVEQMYSSADIIGYVEDQDVLVLRGEDGRLYTHNPNGNTADIVYGDYESIALNGTTYYHYMESDDGVYSFYSYDLQTKDTISLGSITVPSVSGWGRSMETVCVGDDGIYFIIGYYGGTGFFFQEADIYFLSFETGEITVLVDNELTYPMMYLAQDEMNSYLYYYSSSDVLGISLYQGCMSKDVSRIDLNTGETTLVEFPLCEEGVPFIYNGELMVLEEGKLEPTVIISTATAQAMGYAYLGFLTPDDHAVYHKTVDLVDGVYYVTLYEVVSDAASSMGWRPGFRRVSAMLYAINAESGEIELIHSY